ncbi:hypothetical protein ACPC54_20475 [Kitasatospora sp. NPDC094028]
MGCGKSGGPACRTPPATALHRIDAYGRNDLSSYLGLRGTGSALAGT